MKMDCGRAICSERRMDSWIRAFFRFRVYGEWKSAHGLMAHKASVGCNEDKQDGQTGTCIWFRPLEKNMSGSDRFPLKPTGDNKHILKQMGGKDTSRDSSRMSLLYSQVSFELKLQRNDDRSDAIPRLCEKPLANTRYIRVRIGDPEMRSLLLPWKTRQTGGDTPIALSHLFFTHKIQLPPSRIHLKARHALQPSLAKQNPIPTEQPTKLEPTDNAQYPEARKLGKDDLPRKINPGFINLC